MLRRLLALAGLVILAAAQSQAEILAANGIALNTSLSAYLQITYNSTNLQPGEQLNPGDLTQPPDLYLTNATTALNSTYLLVLFDPDAPTPQNSSLSDILHWGMSNLTVDQSTGKLVNGTAFAPYNGPKPPQGSDAHRYIFFVYDQNNASLPSAFMNLPSSIGAGRTGINVTNILASQNITNPIAASFLKAAYDGSFIYSSGSSSSASSTRSTPASTVYSTLTVSGTSIPVVTVPLVVEISTASSTVLTTVYPSSSSSRSPPMSQAGAAASSLALTASSAVMAAIAAIVVFI